MFPDIINIQQIESCDVFVYDVANLTLSACKKNYVQYFLLPNLQVF